MYKLKTKNLITKMESGGNFQTIKEAEDFFEDYKSKGLWGKEAHIVHHEERVIHHETQYDNSGNMVGVVIAEAWDEIVPAWDEQIPAEYTYAIEDHTAELEEKRAKKEAKDFDRVNRVSAMKNINWANVNSVVELKAIVKHLVSESLKDD